MKLNIIKYINTCFIPLIACVLVFGIFSYIQPYWLDSLPFQRNLHGICGDSLTINGYAEYYLYELHSDNGRIFNLMSPLLMDYLPKWLDGALVGLMASLMLWAMGKLIGLWRTEGTLWRGLFMLMFLCLPWSNNLLVPVYSLNYIYPTACSLTAIYLSLRPGRLNTAGAFVSAVLGAWGHEGIGGILVAGAVPMILLVKQFGRYGILYAISAVGTAVAVVLFFTSLLLDRLPYEIDAAWMVHDVKKWLMFNFFTVSLIVMLVACVCRRSWRDWLVEKVRDNPMVVYFVSLSMAGMMLSGITRPSYRVTFWPQVCAMVTWGIVLLPVMRRNIGLLRPMAWCLGTVCAFLVVGEIWVGSQFSQSYECAQVQLFNSQCNTAYVKMLHPASYPKWITRFAPRYMFVDYYQIRFPSYWYDRDVAIVPEELRGVNTSIPSDSIVTFTSGISYFRPSQKVDIEFNIIGNVYTPEGICYGEPLSVINFQAEDGNLMTWVQPLYIPLEEVVGIDADLSQMYKNNR